MSIPSLPLRITTPLFSLMVHVHLLRDLSNQTLPLSPESVFIKKRRGGGYDFTSGDTYDAIREGMLARVNDFWPTFKQIPDEIKNVMFEEFVNSFIWQEDVSRENVNKLWKIKAVTKYREWVYQMHKYRMKHEGLEQEIFDQFLAYWESLEFKAVSARNASSRNQNPRLHCRGSRSYADYRNDLYTELHREPSSWEIYCKTHKVESAYGMTTSGWIDDAFTEFATKFQEKIDELSSQGMDVTQDVEESVFSEISTSLAKRMDRRPNYGNISMIQRHRDRATSSSNDGQVRAQLEEKVEHQENEINVLRTQYNELR